MFEHKEFLNDSKTNFSGIPTEFRNVYLDTVEQDMGIKLDSIQILVRNALEKMLFETYNARVENRKKDKKNLNLFLGGTKGTGKTMLACSAINFKNSYDMYYDSQIGVWDKIRSIGTNAFEDGKSSEKKEIDFFSTQALVVIDEIRMDLTDYEKKILEQIIMNRNEFYLPTVLIGNLSTMEIQKLFASHIFDRIANEGTILINSNPSYRGGVIGQQQKRR